MGVKFVDTGARRYVAGTVEQFDQKNEMFCRPLWDEEMLNLGKKFYMTDVPPKDKDTFFTSSNIMGKILKLTSVCAACNV